MKPKSWAPMVRTDTTDTWASNALRFATYEEAMRYARDLSSRWTLVLAISAVASDDEVNCEITEAGIRYF